MSLKKILIVVIVLVFPLFTYGQMVPPPIPPPPPPGLPIDGFTGLLFVLGMVYGSKKIFKNNSSKFG
ncbi:PID-CTERM protein-sorting domain-containing protein [uncultured Polaribacter sp.]|uniref:PID-CTERM protein-sorting domain-containing protein n=1 Tax=uncultured Polaribacter sp. TaxID=174711 RepID=UPI00262CF788|nr:hypothetical protein [uncultured Polaribacter sp.]